MDANGGHRKENKDCMFSLWITHMQIHYTIYMIISDTYRCESRGETRGKETSRRGGGWRERRVEG